MDSLPPILWLKDGTSGCTKPLAAASSDLQLMQDTLRILREWNIIGVANGAAADVDRWKAAGGHRIIPALSFALPNVPTVDILRQWFLSGRFAVLGEVENQDNGIGPDDPRFEPYLSLAEELDIPNRLPYGFRTSGRSIHRDEEVPCPPW
jgi:hypothetical protein